MCFLSRWHPTHWLICAQSWHGCGLRDGDLRPLCEHGVASLKANGANACLVLDDQVALVPACAAAAFFFSGRGTPRRAHECETQPEDASDLRLTWNASISAWGDGRGSAWRVCPKPTCWGGGHETTLTRHCARRRLPLVIAAFRVRPTAAKHSLVDYPVRERFLSCNASDTSQLSRGVD